MAWLAAGAIPPLHANAADAATTFLPYRLFSDLVAAGNNLMSPARRAAPPPAHLDRALADEEAGDDGNSTPGIESRTLTLESGDTLAGVLEDAGVPSGDVNTAILALSKVFDLRDARAGQTFIVTFETAPAAQPPAPAKPAPTAVVRVNGKPVTVSTVDPGDDDGAAADGDVTPVTTPVGRLLSIAFSPSVEHNIAVTRAVDGGFTANDEVKEL